MIKRLFDITASIIALILLSPLLLAIIIALRLTGEGEVIYRQERIGRHGNAFLIYKFATMLKDSPKLAGGDITVAKDPRVLPFGRFLRKTKINELPQLVNVLRGDMSIIGPRPLTKRVAELFLKRHMGTVFEMRPGLSGIGSIVFRDEERLLTDARDRERFYSQDIAPYKGELESWYADNQSLGLDITLIVLTIVAIFRPNFQIRRWLKSLPNAPQSLLALENGRKAV